LYKGFKEVLECDLIDKLPRFIGVQVKGYSPIVDRILGEESIESDKAIPELSIVPPMNMPLAIKAIKESGGIAIRVDYDDVLEALKLLSMYEGVLVEVAAASTIAVLRKLRDKINSETVLTVLTGEGLKDPVTVRELTKGVRRRLGIDIGEISRIGRTKLKILSGIREGYNYGYSIWRYLSSHGINIKLPTVYQHLNELEKLGLVKLKKRIGLTRQKAVYVLTKKGEELSKLFPE
jgi:threonine synthase